jgi:hypothetical protein
VNGPIYIASKTKHAPRWRALRAKGAPIVASWIDMPPGRPAEEPDYGDLWTRCAAEAAGAATLIAYVEEEEQLSGALVEVGIALASGVPVLWCGPTGRHTVTRHAGVQVIASSAPATALKVALAIASGTSSPSPARATIRRAALTLADVDARAVASLLALGTRAELLARCHAAKEYQGPSDPRPWSSTTAQAWLESLALQLWNALAGKKS